VHFVGLYCIIILQCTVQKTKKWQVCLRCLYTRFHVPYSGDSLVNTTKLQYKDNFRVTTIQKDSVSITATALLDKLPITMSFYSSQKIYCNKDMYFWHAFNLLFIFVNLRYDKNGTNSDCSKHNTACNTGNTIDSNRLLLWQLPLLFLLPVSQKFTS
jgi:hypothetical protein